MLEDAVFFSLPKEARCFGANVPILSGKASTDRTSTWAQESPTALANSQARPTGVLAGIPPASGEGRVSQRSVSVFTIGRRASYSFVKCKLMKSKGREIGR